MIPYAGQRRRVLEINREEDFFIVDMGVMEPAYLQLSSYERNGMVKPHDPYHHNNSRSYSPILRGRRATRKSTRKHRKNRAMKTRKA